MIGTSDLIKIDNEVRITSVELVDMINKFRKEEGNETEKRHDVLLRDIRNELKSLKQAGIVNAHNFVEVTYTDAKCEERPCYKMNKAGAMQILNKESPVVRYKTQQYIEALEEQLKDNKPKLPTTYKEALIALVQEVEAKEEAEKQRDKLIHQNKLYNTTEIAKDLGFKSATALNKDLAERRTQYKTHNTWVLCSEYANRGYTSIKQTELESGRIIYDRKWSGSGRDFILSLYTKAQGGM